MTLTSNQQLKRPFAEVSLGLIERFADIAQLNDLLNKLKSDKLTKRELIAIREFNKALKRRVEGKPDNVGVAMHDPDEEVLE